MKTPDPYQNLIVPEVYLSSEGLGWEDVTVRAYYEPAEIEGWVDPVVRDVALVLMSRGTMLMERRHTDGSWKGTHIRQGDLFLKASGQVGKEIRWRTLSDEPMETVHIHLNHILFCNTVEAVTGRDPARLTLVGLSGFQDPLLAQIGLALFQELQHPSSAGKLYAQTAAQMMALHLLRTYTEVKIRLPDASPRHIERAKAYILAHLQEELSLPVLAYEAGFSPFHFARQFRQATGESPHQFVLRQRIERAAHLLKDTDFPLAHIALECGFSSHSHLTQVFKRQRGLTPNTYRQQHRARF